LPSRFAGFTVHQLNLGDKRKAYLETWKRLFKELKAWDDETTLKWAEKWDDALSGRRPSAIYHYGPVKMALSTIVDDSTKASLGSKLGSAYTEMISIIERTQDKESRRVEHPDTMANYDWSYTRRGIRDLIEKYTKN
jgi:hypothetical protein